MGTYTPNYGLYKPAIGEKEWGDKVNANFDTIDSVMHENRSQISRIKKDLLTVALNVMMNKALVHAETKDFYSIIADVITDEYPYGFKNTFETIPSGVKFDNDGGGTWTKAIKIPLTTVPSEYAQYRIVIQSNTMQIYSADGTLKADYGAETGVASDFWNNVKSDGSDIRIADQDYSQLYFWIEEFDYSGKYAVIWVKIPANTTELYIVYGNPDALPSAYNSGENTFEFFDDFESLDNWDVHVSAGNVRVENSLLILDGSTSATAGINGVRSKVTFSKPVILELKLIATYVRSGWAWRQWGFTDAELTQEHLAQQNNVIRNQELDGRTYFRVTKNGTSTQVSLDPITEWHVETIIWGDVARNYWNNELKAEITTNIPDIPLYIGIGVGNNSGAEAIKCDWVRILKLADPAEFGDAEVITLVTTGDFITVTFDFPEGVDKLLITVDTDAQAVYYSTDDGQTWNAIEPDTETPLPETAYSIKWKFEFATYVRGYAFITW